MRIGIDYSGAVWQRAGIGRYVRLLTEALLQLDHDNDYILIYAGGFPGRPAPFLENLQRVQQEYPRIQERPIPLSHRWATILWQRLRLPIPVELFCGQLDLFWAPDFVLPPQLSGLCAITVHDVAFLIHPECTVPSLQRYLEQALRRSIARADLILAGSKCTRQDIIELLEVDPERVVLLYSGVHPSFSPLKDQDALESIRERYNLPERFLLTVGTIEPRKNLPRLLEAMAGLPQPERLPLIVAGQPGWLYEETFSTVERLDLQSSVQFIGFVPDADMPALYNLAHGLAYPSIYEGFGVPPLEAMACGIPVLTSNVSALPEVAGEAALLVDPTDVDAIREGLRRIIEDEALRVRMRSAGLERAKLFTWGRAAERLLELMESTRVQP